MCWEVSHGPWCARAAESAVLASFVRGRHERPVGGAIAARLVCGQAPGWPDRWYCWSTAITRPRPRPRPRPPGTAATAATAGVSKGSMARKVGHLKIKLNGVFEMVTARGTYFKYPLSLNLKVCLSPVCLCGCGQMTGCLRFSFLNSSLSTHVQITHYEFSPLSRLCTLYRRGGRTLNHVKRESQEV
jgi:hypothetical protein